MYDVDVVIHGVSTRCIIHGIAVGCCEFVGVCTYTRDIAGVCAAGFDVGGGVAVVVDVGWCAGINGGCGVGVLYVVVVGWIGRVGAYSIVIGVGDVGREWCMHVTCGDGVGYHDVVVGHVVVCVSRIAVAGCIAVDVGVGVVTVVCVDRCTNCDDGVITPVSITLRLLIVLRVSVFVLLVFSSHDMSIDVWCCVLLRWWCC